MRWRKMGCIFNPEGQSAWFVSHAGIPVAEHIENDLFRIYFSGRDEQGRAQIGYFVIDLNKPHQIQEVSPEPVISLGPLGSYDDAGITAGCIVHHEGSAYQYYSGWSLGQTVPFYFYIGLAVRQPGKSTFKKFTNSPILGRSAVDPYLTASPSVLIEEGLWRMWYVSAREWVIENDRPKHFYHIRYAESDDGIHWRRDGRVCIDFADEIEYAIARPHVLKDGNSYKMWYSYRGAAYRLGYAESADGLTWERRDHLVGIDVSDTGWDCDMLAYATVFDHAGVRYMLYNGNGYGQSGIGYAVLE